LIDPSDFLIEPSLTLDSLPPMASNRSRMPRACGGDSPTMQYATGQLTTNSHHRSDFFMIPYEKNDRLVAAIRGKDHQYELHKTKVLANVARNSLLFE
jgi:hypothetical protein